MTRKNQKNERTVLEILFVGILKVIWWLVSFPFRRKKGGRKLGLQIDERNFIVERRQEIERMLISGNIAEKKQAVMEADKLVDYIFQALGYPGETFADRLRNAEPYIEQNLYNEIWQGHKVRNQLAHEHNAIRENELKQAAEKLLRYVKKV